MGFGWLLLSTLAWAAEAEASTAFVSRQTSIFDRFISLAGLGVFVLLAWVLSDNRKPHEMRRYGEKSVEVAEPYLHFFIERYKESFDAEIGSFADAVNNGGPTEVTFEDGRRALILAEAAYLSRAEGRAVKVSEVE